MSEAVDFRAILDRLPDRGDWSKHCLDCRDIENYRACRLPGDNFCRSGWHFRVTPGVNFGETCYERCPIASRTKAQKIADQIRAREDENARRLLAEAESERRIRERARELAKGDR